MSNWQRVGRLVAAAGLLSGLATAGEWADITPKRTGDYDANKATGYCMIKVRVDIETIVHVRWDRVAFETMAGTPSSDEGTECSQPLPNGNALANFRFRGVDGRGEQTLLEAPSASNSWTARIRIRDSRGGSEGFTGRIEWDNRGGSTGVDNTGWRGTGSGTSAGGWGTPASTTTNSGGRGTPSANTGGSGSTWSGNSNSEYSGSVAGNGRFEVRNGSTSELSEARLDLRRNGQFLLELRGPNNVLQDLSGRWIRRGNGAALEITQGLRNSGATGRGNVEFQGSQPVRFTVTGRDPRANNEFRAELRTAGATGGGWGGNSASSNAGWGNTPSSNSGWGNNSPSSNSGWGNNSGSSNAGWDNSTSSSPSWGSSPASATAVNVQQYRGSSLGTGTIVTPNGRQMALSEARIEIRANGEALVEFRGQTAPSFFGRVENQTNSEATIRVTKYGKAAADGTLRVHVSGGQLDRVDGQIRARNGGELSVAFRRQ